MIEKINAVMETLIGQETLAMKNIMKDIMKAIMKDTMKDKDN